MFQCNILCINARIKHIMVYWLSVIGIDRVSGIKKFISDMVRKVSRLNNKTTGCLQLKTHNKKLSVVILRLYRNGIIG